jgi:hypothetical protein
MCFPGNATVLKKTTTGMVKCKMGALSVDDEVLTDSGFSPVVSWLHRDTSTKSRPYLRLVFAVSGAGTRRITLSADHLIFRNRTECVPAAEIVSGDELCVFDHGRLNWEVVVGKSRCVASGVYCPLTETGTIIVDGVLCSCYSRPTSLGIKLEHAMGQLVMLPLRKKLIARADSDDLCWHPYCKGLYDLVGQLMSGLQSFGSLCVI